MEKKALLRAVKYSLRFLSDENYIKFYYFLKFKKLPDLANPKTFNEKLNWLKLHVRKPEYTTLVDKYAVKEYIAQKIGPQYIIPTLGVWNHFDEIDFDALPDKFVLKCTHDSKGVVVVSDKSKMDREAARKVLESSLKINFYYTGREWPYKNVPPRIICEQYMSDTPDSDQLSDYKFVCFGGKVDGVEVCVDRNSGDTKFYYFDRNWKLLPYFNHEKEVEEGFTVKKPDLLNEMWEIAENLSADLPFARIDLYYANNHIYFGEVTLYPDAGFDASTENEVLSYWGSKLILPEVY